MRVIVTCGPSSEPIDEVRSLTNFSTGELGALICTELHRRGFEVICLRSVTATSLLDSAIATVIPFATNADLTMALEKLSKKGKVLALFHAAALCDYRVTEVATAHGKILTHGKIPTSCGPLTMTLQPTEKVIAHLRSWFPSTLLVGWKYEIDGSIEDAHAKAHQQITKYQLDASIVNGKVLGSKFDFIPAVGVVEHLDSKVLLALFLGRWLVSIRPVGRTLVPSS